MKFGQIKVPLGFYIIILSYLCYTAANTPNIMLTAPIAIFPLVAYKLLWIPRQLNVLFWGMMMQWMAVFILPFYCNILGVTMEAYFGNMTLGVTPALMDLAIYLSTIAIYFFLFGLYFGVRKLRINNIDEVMSRYSLRAMFWTYLAISVAINLSSIAIWSFPGLVQYFYHLFLVKWGFLVILFYKVHKFGVKRDRLILYLIMVSEFIIGLSSSFFASSFLNILFFTFIGVTALQPKLKLKHYIVLLVASALIFHLGVLWTATKRDYRHFANQGTLVQNVSVSKEDAIFKLYEMTSKVSPEQYQRGIIGLIMRLGYTYYFSVTLDYVPKVVEHQYGAVYGSAIGFYLMPRILFPDKEVLDDSKHLTKYTGQHYNGAEAGASFSLGYVPDAYIDFGPVFMFVILFFFGYLFGVCYFFLYSRSINEVWAWILTTPFFLLTNIYGADTKKALGGLLLYFVTISLLRKILMGRIDPIIKERKTAGVERTGKQNFSYL